MPKYKKQACISIIEAAAKSAHWKMPGSAEVIHLRNMLKRYKGFGSIRKWEIKEYEGSDWDVGGQMSSVKIVDQHGQEWSFP